MTEWLLIVLFWSHFYGYASGAVPNSLLVPSFKTEVSCKEAGDKIKRIPQSESSKIVITYVCVQK